MRDGLVLAVIAIIFIILPGSIQFALLRIFKSVLVRLVPVIIFFPIWFVCVLGAFSVIDLSMTETIINGGFIAFPDYIVIAIIGIPIIIGLALAWLIYMLMERHKNKGEQGGE